MGQRLRKVKSSLMENLFNYIAFLQKYFNLLVETEDAGQLMKQEIKTNTFQRDRCFRLRKECVKVYDTLFKTFEKDLIELGNEVAVEILRRDNIGQELLYAQLLDLLNEFAKKFNKRYEEQGFSEEVIGKKSARINIEKTDGKVKEQDIEFDFSIMMLADDLSDKFNQLQDLISERFKFLKSKKSETRITNNGLTKLTYLLQLYYEKGCKPLNKQQVQKLAKDKDITEATLINKWKELKRDCYNHNGNTNNIKSFMFSYEQLLKLFKDNIIPLNDVKNRYDQLKEIYPDLTY